MRYGTEQVLLIELGFVNFDFGFDFRFDVVLFPQSIIFGGMKVEGILCIRLGCFFPVRLSIDHQFF